VEVPEEVRAQAKEKVARLGRHAPVLERAEVRLTGASVAATDQREVCEVIASGHGYTIRARAAARDIAQAVDLVVDKLDHQAERLKGRLVGRSHPRRSRQATLET
jgi:ribosomal subunit interface protein